MQKYLAILLLCSGFISTSVGHAQSVNFQDGFEDGNFTQNPVWSGDTSQYTVIEGQPVINAQSNHLLQLQGDAAGGVSYLSTPSTNSIGTWEFYVNLDFSPSGGNHANIFLMSNIADLEGSVNGYALQVGESGSNDVFRIVRYDNGAKAGAPILSGTTDISGGGNFRVKVRRQSGGVWTLEVAPGYDGNLAQEGGTATDATYNTTQFFGVRSTYTSSRADKFTYDFKIKLPPFTVSKARANGNQVDVTFSRPYDKTSVKTTDFSVDNGLGSPTSESFPSSTVVRLTYGSVLASNKYTLTAQNISAQNGDAIAAGASASFIVYDTFADGDVNINEFSYDPPSGQPEYVELKNLSAKYLNLRNWQIGDDSHLDNITSDSVALPPNGFIVISSDTSALFNVYGSRPYIQASTTPSFNNSGDVVRILTNDNRLVDSLNYNPTWGGSNVALERRSDTAAPIKANFGDSPDPLGGTPGLANKVSKDATPPALDGLNVADNQTLNLNFSEQLSASPAADASNYSLDNGISVSSATQTAPDSVQLSLSSPLQNGSQYQLTINNQQDIFGNTAAQIDTTFSYFVVSPPDSGDIFINEFLYDPPSGSSEYIELYNTSSKSLNLNGWTINDNTGDLQTITNNRFVIPPDSFAVLAPDQSLLTDHPGINLLSPGSRFPSLNNGGDAIVVRDSTGQLLDSLTYTPAFGGNKVAVERRTTNAPPVQANFGDAPNGFGTPGAANDIGEDTTPPSLQNFAILSDQSLQFVFTETVTNQTATNTENYSLSGGLSIQSAALAGGDTVRVQLSGSLQNNTTYTVTIDGIEDVFGNAIANRDTTFTFLKTSQADSGDVFINEFTYDPPDGSTEYVELYNPTSKSLDLQNWTINDNTGRRRTITEGQFIVRPDSFVVLAPDNTLLDERPGISLVALGSRFPSLNNSGDDIVIRRADGIRLDSLTYTPAFGGNGVAVERRSVDAPPVTANFGDAPNGFGTPGEANQIGEDTTPPDLRSLAIPDSQTLKLAYSETLNKAAATTTSNYALSNGIKVSSAQQTADDSVRLKLSSPLQNGTKYNLSIKNQQDIFGNTAAQIDTTFSFFNTSQADSGEVFINEFTYDPPDGSTEYVELYNPTSKSFNLNGWTINDNTGKPETITNSRFIIPPNGYAVLAPDRTLQGNRPDINLIPLGSRFPSLNNSGDNIVIRRADGTRLDSLTYTRAFGGNGLAVERRTVDAPPIAANFGDAPNGFGTPGEPNQIQPDNEPPTLNSFSIVNDSEFQLIFSETLKAQTATNLGNYTLQPNPGVELVSARNDTVDLFSSQKLQTGQQYSVSVSGVQDVFGNTIANSTTLSATFIKISNARPKDVVINEIKYQTKNGSDPEFVELFNRTDRNFDLSGWQIGDASSPVTIDKNARIQGGKYIVLTDNKSFAENLDNAVFLSDFPSLNDKGDAVYIKNDKGVTIDSLFYSPAFGGNIDGKSAERKDPAAASNDPSNFATSAAASGSTPDARNSVFKRDETTPGIKFARLLPNGNVEVTFTEFISLTKDLQFTLNGQALSVVSFKPDEANMIILKDPGNIPGDTKLTLKAGNLTDVSGNKIDSNEPVSFSVALPAKKGNVVLNEILYDPINDSNDNKPDQSEYIELRNIKDYAVSLEGISIHDAPDENGSVRTISPVTTNAKYIAANGTALFYAENNTPVFSKSEVATFFNIAGKPDHTLLRADRSTLSLASTGDAVYLANKDGATIDSAFYDESWQNPNLADTKGIALERINPLGPGNTDANWSSSTSELGGTPDAENTIFEEPNTGKQQNAGISFSSNPFSPDGDGDADNLFINYKLDRSDYLISVTIYDRYGRKIRQLADGKQAGFNGSLIWDGLKDDGTRNRIGIYIVIFKAFDSADGNSITFKKTVVLARRFN